MANLRPDFTFSEGHLLALQKFAYDEMVRLSQIVDKTLPPQAIDEAMSALTEKAKQAVNAASDLEKTQQLVNFFYRQEGFTAHQAEVSECDQLNLASVLRTKNGSPEAFSAILLKLAHELKLPIYAVTFPFQLLLRAEILLGNSESESHFIDPRSGEFVTVSELEKRLEGNCGYAREVDEELLAVAHMPELVDAIETAFKLTLTRAMRLDEALEIIAYRLEIQPDEPYNVRDRGLIYATKGLREEAVRDLQHFMNECPDDPSLLAIAERLQSLGQPTPLH